MNSTPLSPDATDLEKIFRMMEIVDESHALVVKVREDPKMLELTQGVYDGLAQIAYLLGELTIVTLDGTGIDDLDKIIDDIETMVLSVSLAAAVTRASR